MNVILAPVITEKSLTLAGRKLYTFAVAPSATKSQIKTSLQTLFGVHVTRVNLNARHVSARRTGSKRLLGASSTRKLCVVQLKTGESLDIFEVKG